ncbi:hypothetical protein [Agromyces humi]|uniref:hypothetical protein n=1 Tax=Agromyces humi TaxID=1766800 RepID=UPI00135CE3C4|nr:hypothetical protein [Agromyces humi]
MPTSTDRAERPARRPARTPIRELNLYDLARQRTTESVGEAEIDWIPSGKYLDQVAAVMAGVGQDRSSD